MVYKVSMWTDTKGSGYSHNNVFNIHILIVLAKKKLSVFLSSMCSQELQTICWSRGKDESQNCRSHLTHYYSTQKEQNLPNLIDWKYDNKPFQIQMTRDGNIMEVNHVYAISWIMIPQASPIFQKLIRCSCKCKCKMQKSLSTHN